jgi:tRNA(Ile2)-agmatinylcytidine synthase
VLSELLAEARRQDVDLIGEPRLVRLNPNIPWKTRGNAALAARFGAGSGPRRKVGEVEGGPVWSYPRGRPLDPGRSAQWLEAAWDRVLASSRAGEPGTDPALVAVTRPLPASLYWAAVREVVPVAQVEELLVRRKAFVRTSGSRRGIVGAAAATAWREHRPTWELIAYRLPGRWQQIRVVDPESVRAAQQENPDLFLCEDPRTRRLLVAPHTPCPILYGLRGTRPRGPLAARRRIRSETVDRWVLFRTNQGSGDHLVRRMVADLSEFESGVVVGTVITPPQLLRGGHVRFSMTDREGDALPCVAFEPTKTLPRIARELVPGDRLRVWGSRTTDAAFRLEGIELLRLASRTTAPRPPRCPACDRSAHSLGRLRGYRCQKCHRKWPPEAALVRANPSALGIGVYHPTPSARRHLAPRGPEP